MNLFEEIISRQESYYTRRHFLRNCSLGLGAVALGSLLGCVPDSTRALSFENPLKPQFSLFAPKAKRVIFLHMAGAPSQLELFDYKPELHKIDGQECPQSFLEGKRFAFIQGVPRMLGPQSRFKQHGQSGAWVSELFPHFQEMVDEVAFLKAVYTDEFNHAPAQMFMHTGSPRMGRPSMGSWLTYGLGSENENLPGFVVLVSGESAPSGGKSLWGSGFLPSHYQGVQFQSQGDPVIAVSNPQGISRDIRKQALETIKNINQKQYEDVGDPEILSRISQYEMAFKMQMTVPEAMNIDEEPDYIHEMYGTEPGQTSFANNCLLARRLAERDVRFIQLFHRGWDSHGSNEFEALEGGFLERCKEVDKPMTALIKDLKQRGLLEDTLVVWGGEFGRTPMRENRGGKVAPYNGRDHHGDAFTMWMAGGGVKPGLTYGETDEFGYFGIKERVHVHDLQATILHQMGIDHEKLTFRFQGRDFRLTDVHGHVVKDILV
ncbi:MAG: DUF1501 domain-containing protein [Bacteroidetes bacterium]|nr:DUF1501 domain-containing protein [Bacteroidota bacterium]